MNSDTALDYAMFQLSPKRSHCELFVFGDGRTERIASGVLKPFVAHLKILKEKVSQALLAIKLDVGGKRSGCSWFNKGTLERFVRFVSTPEILEMVNTYDAEMSQLEGAKRLYSQGIEDQLARSSAENEKGTTGADATKKELQRAIEVRLEALKQDLTMASARASAAGFTIDTISELILFADYFGAKRLSEACNGFISLHQRRSDLTNSNSLQNQWPQKIGSDLRASSDSDMSIDDNDQRASHPTVYKLKSNTNILPSSSESGPQQVPGAKKDLVDVSASTLPNSRHLMEKGEAGNKLEDKGATSNSNASSLAPQPLDSKPRRLSVQDRINMFERKQKQDTSNAAGAVAAPAVTKVGARPVELQRVSSDLSTSSEKPVLRRWSGASDMSIDLNCSDNRSQCGMSVPSSPRISQEQNQAGCWNGEREANLGHPQSTVLMADQPSLLLPIEKSYNKAKSSDDQLEKQIMSEKKETSYSGKDHCDLINQNGSQAHRSSDKVSSLNHHKGTSVAKDIDNREKVIEPFSKRAYNLESKDITCSGTKEQNRVKESCEDLIYDVSPGINRAGLDNAQMSSSLYRAPEGCVQIEQPIDQPAILNLRSKTEAYEINKEDLYDSQIQFKEYIHKKEVGAPTVKSQESLLVSKLEENTKTDSVNDVTRFSGIPIKTKGGNSAKATSSLREPKFHKQTLAPDQVERLRGKMTRSAEQISIKPVQKDKKANESLVDNQAFASSREVSQNIRLAKGNKELNNELKMKADELEKLFAEHKLRIDGDQSESSQIVKDIEFSTNNLPRSMDKRTHEFFTPHLPKKNVSIGSGVDLDAATFIDSASNPDYLCRFKLGDFDASEDSRGKFYDKYMLKRDAKLRDEWQTKGALKEAKLKAMHDSLEQSSAEMKVKFARSSVRSDTLLPAQQRLNKLRSFGYRANVKYRE